MKNKHLLLTTLITFACFIGGGGVTFAQKTLPYSCDFNFSSLTEEGWTTSGTPSGGDNVYSSSGYTYPGHTETKCYRFATNNGSYTEQYLISPELESSSGLNVEFYYNGANSHHIKIGYSTTNTSSFTWIDDQDFSSSSYTKYSKDIDIPNIKYIALLFYNNTGAWQSKFLDDFTFTALSAPSSSTIPTGLIASSIKTHGATLTWNGNENALSYNVRYRKTSEIELTNVTGITTNTLELSNLEEDTKYEEVQVQAVYDENTSEWCDAIDFTTLPLLRYTSTYSYQSWSSTSAWTPNTIPTSNHDVLIEHACKISSGNATANNITINADASLNIQNTRTLTCNNITNNGTLVIEDGGQLICNNNPTVTMQKSINSWATTSWYFISSPISTATTPTGLITDNYGSTATEETATYDLYLLDVTQDKEWQNYRQHNFNLTNGMGYLYASKNGTTLSFSGTIQPSNEDIVLNGLNDGFNLVGNPYTCTAYVNQPHYTLSQANDGITSSTVATANTTPIAPLTGVIINGTSATFSKDAPVGGSKGSIGIMLAKVGTRSNATIDNAIVSFNEGSQLEKFYFMQQNANLYIPQGNEEYAIVNAQAQGELPVNFKANENGQYTLTVNVENVEMNYLHLIDNMTGDNIDLLATPSYTFNAKTTDYESRFRLLFATNGIEENDATSSATFAYINNGEIIVNGEGMMQVMDITGRILVSHNGDTRCVPTTGMAPGVYVIRLINGDSVRSQKIVVK